MLDAGDAVLFKASRGVGLERAVARARREPRVRADAVLAASIRSRRAYPVFNVFRYITFRTAMAAVTALLLRARRSARR